MKQFKEAKNLDQEPVLSYKTLYQLTSLILILIFVLSLTSCMKQNEGKTESTPDLQQVNKQTEEIASLYANKGLSRQTLHELQEVKEATAKYHNVNNAFRDQYVDINLKLPNMGYHFLKSELVNPVFDLRKPPILVYNKKDNGKFELVAVEYAVPIDSSHLHTPPRGFTGDADEWDFNTLNTGWWTLHAWVWKFNPDGVFKPMNPTVIVK